MHSSHSNSWTVPAGSLHFEEGPTEDVELQWATYYDAADQAGQSRIYGGIHIVADDFSGRVIGSVGLCPEVADELRSLDEQIRQRSLGLARHFDCDWAPSEERLEAVTTNLAFPGAYVPEKRPGPR